MQQKKNITLRNQNRQQVSKLYTTKIHFLLFCLPKKKEPKP